MILKMTPADNDLVRSILLAHSRKIRNTFILILFFMIPLSLFIGSHYSEDQSSADGTSVCLKYVAKITTGEKSGTAFLISDPSGDFSGLLLTAGHVVAESSVGEKVSLEFPYITDGIGESLNTTATVLWTSNVPFDGTDLQSLRYDVALLKLDDMAVIPEDVIGFVIGQEVRVKDEIDVFGFPSGEPYYASGEVANDSYKGCDDLFVTNIKTEKGHSGSPVYRDAEQEVIGIVIATQEGTDLMNIALKITRVRDLMMKDGKSL